MNVTVYGLWHLGCVTAKGSKGRRGEKYICR
jgi:hypothetical protein